MEKINKYKIMEKELKDINIFTENLSYQLIKLNYQRKNNLINDSEYEDEKNKLIILTYPYLKTLSHIGYENSLDMSNISTDSILFYLYNEEVKFSDTLKFYSKSIDGYARNLIIFAIIDSEIKNDEMKNQKYLDIRKNGIKSIYQSINNSNLNGILTKLCSDDFTIKKLSENEINLLNDYHSLYMQKNIYSKINYLEYNEKQVAILAKKIIHK